jgi:serine/threonine protein kinase
MNQLHRDIKVILSLSLTRSVFVFTRLMDLQSDNVLLSENGEIKLGTLSRALLHALSPVPDASTADFGLAVQLAQAAAKRNTVSPHSLSLSHHLLIWSRLWGRRTRWRLN